MAGGKTGRGKKIPREESAMDLTRSEQNPFGGQKESVSGRKGAVDGGMAGSDGANSRMHIPEFGICSSAGCRQ